MSFDIFDESYYLANNPDVAAAVAAGAFASGLQHFQQFGLNEGRTNVSSLYSEPIYLQLYADVGAAVAGGPLVSGLQHLIQFGEAEGRIGTTGLYNEQAYLQRYPDVAAAVAAGSLSSGLEHFARFVLADSATESRWDALYNETYYLGRHSDVAAAVAAGTFDSGLSHFLSNGLAEGRDGGPNNLFNEGFYLFTNPDVAAAVAAGNIASGLDHFGRFGQAEGRSGSYFNEGLYLLLNPDVAAAVAAGAFASGGEHFLKFGQYEGNRFALFTGAARNDTIRSFGAIPVMSGVAVSDFDPITGQILTSSTGTGEVDFLISKGDISDTMILGNPTTGDVFYQGNGGNDYAFVRGFDPAVDSLLFSGGFGQYSQQVVGSNLNIAFGGDLVAIVEGVTAPLPQAGMVPNGFLLGAGLGGALPV